MEIKLTTKDREQEQLQKELIERNRELDHQKHVISKKLQRIEGQITETQKYIRMDLVKKRQDVLKHYKRRNFPRSIKRMIGFFIHPRVSLQYQKVKKDIQMSGLFNQEYYLKNNDDLLLTTPNLLRHFIQFGWREGRNPSANFDIEYYLRKYPDVASSGINPLIHYLEYGREEGRHATEYNEQVDTIKKSALFDPEWYLEKNKDVKKAGINPLLHFMESGWREGRDPSNKFCTNFYLEHYSEFIPAGMNPLVHYLMYGQKNGHLALPPQKKVAYWKPILGNISVYNRKFRKTENPKVSIVISSYNCWEYTVNCLSSIKDNTNFDEIPYEIILADDCSTDLTQRVEKFFPGVKRVVTQTKSGYIQNIMNGTTHAKGDFIVLLNNKTFVQDGWLDEVLQTFEVYPEAGVVGSLISTPNGIIINSGNLILQDGSTHSCGRGFLPDDPAYNYAREVHYCESFCMTVRRSVWEELDGFDKQFSPTYYEFADFCMSVRKKGLKVMVQSYSRIVHFEHITENVENYIQERGKNKIVFLEKWKKELLEHPENLENIFLSKSLSEKKKTIVVFEGWVPAWDTNAGARAFLHFIKLKAALGYNVKLVFLDNSPREYNTNLISYQKIGFEVWHSSLSDMTWKKWLKDRAYAIDLVFIHRPAVAERVLLWAKSVLRKPVVFFNHDCHFLRESRLNPIENKELNKNIVTDTTIENELSYYVNSDVTLTPSLYEVDLLREKYDIWNAHFIPLFFYDQAEIKYEIKHNKEILFVAGFEHEPNVQGFFWFIDNCWESVLRKEPNATLHVVGSCPPKSILEYNGKRNIVIHGYITDKELEELYHVARLAVIPLTVGAGLKGKLLESMHFGVPVVGTGIALEGCPDIDQVCSSCDSPESFTEDVLLLLKDDDVCEKRSIAGQKLINENFSLDAGKVLMGKYLDMAIQLDSRELLAARNDKLKKILAEIESTSHEQNNNSGIPPAVWNLLYRHSISQEITESKENENTSVEYKLPDIKKLSQEDFNKKHALVISPTHSEFGQGNSTLVNLLNKKLKDLGYIIHFVYYPTDRSPNLDNSKEMPWDYVYEVEIQDKNRFRKNYDKNGNFRPNSHLIDDWCGDELTQTVEEVLKYWDFDICLCHYVWLSRCLEYVPDTTIKIIETHDVFSWRDTNEKVLVGLGENVKNGSGWYSTIPSEERKGLNRSDYVLAVQESDAKFFGTLINPQKIKVGRTVFPKKYQSCIRPDGKIVIGYIAGVNQFHINQVQDIYRRWLENDILRESSELYIAGSIGNWVENNYIDMPDARIQGFVDNLDDFYSSCNVIVNPDFGGSGIKIKCVEALSYGKALVASRSSMNGFESISKYHQADSMDELIDLLTELCCNYEKIEEVSELGKSVYDNYCKDNDLITILKGIVPYEREYANLVQWGNNEDIVFIGGMPRSGTSMMYLALYLNSEFIDVKSGMGETSIFSRLENNELPINLNPLMKNYLGGYNYYLKWIEQVNTILSDMGASIIVSENFTVESTGETYLEKRVKELIILHFFQYKKTISDGKRLVEKTPSHIYLVDDILSQFPKSQFIYCYRGLLDIVASYKKRYESELESGASEETLKWLTIDIETHIKNYKEVNKIAKKASQKYPSRFHVVEYEKMVNAPDVEMRFLCDRCGIKFEDTMVEGTNERKNNFDLVGSSIKKKESEVEKYLSNDEIEKLKSVEKEIDTIVHKEFETCYLHVGLWKTGTTSIQNALHINREILEDQGFLYPSPEKIYKGFSSDAHHVIGIWSRDFSGKGEQAAFGITTISKYIDFQEKFKLNFDNYIDLHSSEQHQLILSSENMEGLTVNELSKLKSFVSQYSNNAKIIVYLRRPDLWSISGYIQAVKRGNLKKGSHVLSPYSYRNIITKFIEIFGKENIIVRIFDPKRMEGGDSVQDFCHTLKIDNTNFIFPTRMDEAISPLSLAYLAEISEHLPRFENDNLVNRERNRIMENVISLGLKDKKDMYVSRKEAMDYYNQYKSEYEWIKKEFLPDYPYPTLFDENFDMYEENYEPSVYTFEQAVEVGAKVWELEYQENKKQENSK